MIIGNQPAVPGFNNLVGESSVPSAVLWIFSPRFLSPQAKRPLIYNFNQSFVNAADTAVSYASQHDPLKLKSLISTPECLTSMYASATPEYMIDMRQLSSSWTFMLVTTNDKAGPGGSSLRTMSDNQILYYGYFVDEPINPLQHMGRLTYNPNAMIMITHKTIINKNTIYGGYERTKLHTMADVDIIHPHVMGPLTSQGVSLLRPEDLYQATTDGSDMIVMHPETSLLERQEDPVGITSQLSVPRNNIEKILLSVTEARGTINADIAGGGSNVLTLGRDSYRGLVEQNLQDNSRLSVDVGLPINRVITLSVLISRYNPRIESIKLDYNPRYTPADQTTTSPRNAFSSMLTSIMPAIMSEFLLIDFGFHYNSHTGELKLYDTVAPVCPMSQDALRFQINGFITRLKTDVFPILKMGHGDFALNMQCSCGGMSYINLNFLADSMTKDVFDVPTILGGINSPLIGTSQAFSHNAKELGLLIGSLVETDRDLTPNLGYYDNNRFANLLIEYDKNANKVNNSQSPQQFPSSNNRWGI